MLTMRRICSLFAVGILVTVWLTIGTAAQPAANQTPAVRGEAVPAFLQPNKRYAVRWQPGDVETYRVLEIKEGWVKGESETKDAPSRLVLWFNPRQAITIQELP